MKKKKISITVTMLCTSGFVSAQTAEPSIAEPPVLPEVKVTAKSKADIFVGATDATQLLSDQPGYSVAAGGGVSGLPVLNGFADDRLKVRLDGMDITSACANHMNSPLSYADPKLLGSITLYPGLTPVSVGGDSIGGTIEVKSPAPSFARVGEGLFTEGRVSTSARSIDRSLSASATGTIATDSLSLTYAGANSRAQSYRDANGNKVLASLYESNNNLLTLAAKGETQQLVLRVGDQRIPYQGFPNEYMDMTGNHSTFANVTYTDLLTWGRIEAKAYWQDTDHEMGFFSPERTGTMPMNTHGRSLGYTLRAELLLQNDNVLRVGNEYHRYRLDDWWPAADTMMMGPNTYVNINNGQRDRYVLFGEWEGHFTSQWGGLLGIRDELVEMNTGNVQSYGSMMLAADNTAAANFNALSHAKTDNNIDLTALAKYSASSTQTTEFGYARKTRSPNLYERYSWGRSSMAMTMTNWFGDGNGYVGNTDLKPEVANTLSASTSWHDTAHESWDVTVTPYYSYVQNYIDADVIGSFNPYMVSGVQGNLLQFANHDARLYGINLAWKLPIFQASEWGELVLRGTASANRGRRTDGGNLYRIMPLNATVGLDQSVGAWTNTLETRLVAHKTNVDAQRVEQTTVGYALFNLRSRYQINSKTSVSAGVSNLFNRQYADPLGGVYLSELNSTQTGPLRNLPGYGRSLDVALSIGF